MKLCTLSQFFWCLPSISICMRVCVCLSVWIQHTTTIGYINDRVSRIFNLVIAFRNLFFRCNLISIKTLPICLQSVSSSSWQIAHFYIPQTLIGYNKTKTKWIWKYNTAQTKKKEKRKLYSIFFYDQLNYKHRWIEFQDKRTRRIYNNWYTYKVRQAKNLESKKKQQRGRKISQRYIIYTTPIK